MSELLKFCVVTEMVSIASKKNSNERIFFRLKRRFPHSNWSRSFVALAGFLAQEVVLFHLWSIQSQKWLFESQQCSSLESLKV